MEQIIIEVDGAVVGEYRLTESIYEIGRSRECAIRVNVPDVSRKHACLERSRDGWGVRPLSDRGAVLNDVMVPSGTLAPLNDGAILLLGEHAVVRFSSIAQEDGLAENAFEATYTPAQGAEGGGNEESVANTLLPLSGSVGAAGERPPDEQAQIQGLPTDAQEADVLAEEPNEDATGLGDFAPDLMPYRDAAGTYDGNDAGGPATQAFDGMHTQAVDAETLAKLRDKMRGQSRRRSLPMLIVLGMLVMAGIIGFMTYHFFYKPPPGGPYPVDKQTGLAIQMERVFPIFDSRSSTSGKGIYLWLPSEEAKILDDQGNMLTMTVSMWWDKSVPMYVMCKAEEDSRFLRMTRDALFADWIASASSAGSLVFGQPEMCFQFIGNKLLPPGIPVDCVTYENTATSGRGVVYVVRTGMKRIILQMEVPDKDFDRLYDHMLSRPTARFRVDPLLMQRHWEPSGIAVISAEQAKAYIDRCRLELGREAPSVWREIYTMLTSVLSYASEKNDKEMEQDALGMLVTLREQQAKWFGGKRNDRDSALNRGDSKSANRIKDECRMVFSSPDDIRFNETRKWK